MSTTVTMRSVLPEATGIAEAVRAGVKDVGPGDRVAYVGRHDAYTEYRLIEADRLVPLPDRVSDEQAVSALLKGSTAHFLVNSIYAVKPGDTVLVHAATGGVRLILGQVAYLARRHRDRHGRNGRNGGICRMTRLRATPSSTVRKTSSSG